ncbi:ANK2 [Symbiodinium microadriaticum]|nr:ANK2 [Symbiodinium microadriaticum]
MEGESEHGEDVAERAQRRTLSQALRPPDKLSAKSAWFVVAPRAELAFPAGDVTDVQALKNQIRQQWGIPVSIQAFLHSQHRLDLSQKLDAPMELQLVQESFHSTSPNRRLLDLELIEYAATTGNYEVARRLLDAGHVEAARLLLRADANPGLCDAYGRQGHVEATRLLLQAGANPGLSDAYGMTALHQLAGNAKLAEAVLDVREGPPDITAMLLRAASEKDMRIWDGKTALILASQLNHAAVARLLLGARANPHLRDDDGFSALDYAAWEGHDEVIHVFFAHLSFTVEYWQSPEGRAPFSYACQKGHVKVARLLLGARACPDSQDLYGYSVLDHAAWQGRVAMVQLLIKVGPKGSLQSSKGLRALHYAMNSYLPNAEKVVRLLLAEGAGRGLPDGDAMSPLHSAAMKGQTAMVDLLLRAGLDKNLQDHEGMTAMMEASCEGQVDVVRMLLTENADCDLRDQEGMTALSHARRHGHAETVRLLLEAGQ